MLLQQGIRGPIWLTKSLLRSSFSKVPSPGSSHLQGQRLVTTTKSQEIVVLPCSNAWLQRALGSQDGAADGAVAAAGDFSGWLGSCCPLTSAERCKVADWG